MNTYRKERKSIDLVGPAVYKIDGTAVVGPRQAHIANAAGGTEIATINAILAALEAHGLVASV